MEWITFKGSHRKVGYDLGAYWAWLFGQESPYWMHWRRIIVSEMSCAWSDEMLPLLENAILYFPELVDEIAGIAKGASDAGFDTKFRDVFAYALGETCWEDDSKGERHGCSSIVVRTEDATILGHNEEGYDKSYDRRAKGKPPSFALTPLCFASVRLMRDGDRESRFASASYPFQLFGSCAGMNSSLAFQGNSIGCGKHAHRLRATWTKRIPKTFFSRSMLESKSIKEVQSLYECHHSTLPNHHYVCDAYQAYTLKVEPDLNPTVVSQTEQLTCESAGKTAQHTNHFGKNGKYGKWIWDDSDDQEDSTDRLGKLKQYAATIPSDGPSDDSVLNALATFRDRHHYGTLGTLASLCFRVTPSGASCVALCYFNTTRRLARLSIRKTPNDGKRLKTLR